MIPCFVENTKVLTINGYVNVENLTNEHIVITHDFRQVKIVNVYYDEVVTSDETSPYIIPSSYFKEGYPIQQFSISPLHAISVNNAAKKWFVSIVHGKGLKRWEYGKKITYYHIELPNWLTDNLVIENGTVVESYGLTYHEKLGLEQPMVLKGNKSGYYIRNYEIYNKLNNSNNI